jgi:hypothetical protein
MKEREERNMKEAKKATLKLRREGKARKERWKKRKGSIWGQMCFLSQTHKWKPTSHYLSST